ncbi:uncharacterized protein LOC117908267 [Vitis riparia]|uniref:uncharacterized protein LOC117908267 n=1 Tax=Vitis riparia TaxID=96939 RepID=UPI00155A8B09|nr:uncharacterized protein LOC117908267 [Vitis riparia]
MPFRLKNASAIYQRLMTKNFKPLIGRIVEVYIDDIVIKSETQAKHAQHLEEAFHLMRAYNMKLNPAKCAFGISTRKFLGFMVTQRGIEVNLAQVKAILETPAPNNKKELQRLTGHFVALGCFIACFIDKLRLFFLTLRGASMFGCTDECEQTFEACRLVSSDMRQRTKARLLCEQGNEYEAVLAELDLALTLAATKLEIRNDSQLIIRQIQREYEAKDECMARYLAMCLNEPEAKYVLAKLHEGVCGNHLGKRTLAHRTYTQGYYWPTMKQDAEKAMSRDVIGVKDTYPFPMHLLKLSTCSQVLGHLHNGEWT